MEKHEIIGVQFNTRVGYLADNASRIVQEIRKHKKPGKPVILVMPEMSQTGYPLQDLVKYKALQEDCWHYLLNVIAPETDADTAVLVGLPWANNSPLPYNAVAWVSNGKVQHIFTKTELPNNSVFDEVRNYRKGKPSVFTWKGVTYGVPICEDIWHARVSKAMKKLGAQILLSPNASPYDHGKWSRRKKVITRRVKQTGLPLFYVNRWGGQDELVFDGQSALALPNGTVTRAAMYEDATLSFTFNGEDVTNVVIDNPFRQLSWGEECFKHHLTGLDYIAYGGGKALLGLSGGIDSALVWILAAMRLGVENVLPISEPSKFSSSGSKTDAQALVDAFGVNMPIIQIEEAVEAARKMLRASGLRVEGLTDENLQARIRGVMNMAYSNGGYGRVLTTGNKSEMSVGYSTLYGDMNGAYNPIKDLYKTEVFRLTRWIIDRLQWEGNDAAAETLQRILDKPPSAELRENQQDTDSLPPYPVLDKILVKVVEELKVPREISLPGIAPETVEKVFTLVQRSEFKRRQAPPGTRWRRMDLDKDWRMPLDTGWKPLPR